MSVSKNFVFTLFPTDNSEWVPQLALFKYLIYQYENTKEGRLHVQGYCQFAGAKRVGAVSKLLGFGAHVEPRRGTHEQAVAYCNKLESRVKGPFEYGVPAPGQGSRTDIAAAMSLSIRQAAIHFPEVFIKFHRGLVARQDWVNSVPEQKPWVVVYVKPEQVPHDAYHIRCTKEMEDRFTIKWVDHWDYYDYEVEAVCETDIGWRPFVKSIYRGMIVNRVRKLFIVDVTSVTSGVGNTSHTTIAVPEPEDNLAFELWAKNMVVNSNNTHENE